MGRVAIPSEKKLRQIINETKRPQPAILQSKRWKRSPSRKKRLMSTAHKLPVRVEMG